jgi:PPOX class probable F420-dependent enzyme
VSAAAARLGTEQSAGENPRTNPGRSNADEVELRFQLMAFPGEKYMLFTSYKRDGTAVATPVWLVELDGDTLGFYTSSESGKAKRLAHTERVTVQPCNARGVVKAGTAARAATARVVDGAEYEQIHAKVVAKYGMMTKFTKFLGTIGGIVKGKRIPYGDRAVIVSLLA